MQAIPKSPVHPLPASRPSELEMRIPPGGWLDRCGRSERTAFLRLGTVRTVQRGTVLHHEGEVAQTLCCVLGGTVLMQRTTAEGGRQVLFLACRGTWFGGEALLSDPHRRASAVVHQRARLLFFPAASVRDFVKRNPAAGLELMREVADQGQRALAFVHAIGCRDARQRAAMALALQCRISREADAAGGWDELPLTQTDLAAMTGLARQTVNRVLRLLKEDGALSKTGPVIAIADHERLLREAGW